ncbi:hypothetical protein Hte_005089 [Hypoxylon texense]
MIFKSPLALLTGLCAVSTASILPRSGTGPKPFLTPDNGTDTDGIQGGSPSVASDGSINFCLTETTATVSDCQAVIGDIRANPGSLSVASGYCLNWYEGGCLGRVCGGTDAASYSASASWIADSLTTYALETCIADGRAGGISDCTNVGGTCGTYHFFLQTYAGGA